MKRTIIGPDNRTGSIIGTNIPYLYILDDFNALTSFIVIPGPALAPRIVFTCKGSDFLFPVQLKVVLVLLLCVSSLPMLSIFSPL